MTRSEGALVLALVALVALVLFGALGVELHHLFGEIARSSC